MIHTDTELKQVLAKMLPDIVFTNTPSSPLRWRKETQYGCEEVLGTELLHLCWLVEETFIHRNLDAASHYWIALRDGVYKTKHSGITIDNALLHASWQQRALALAKVKGVEIV